MVNKMRMGSLSDPVIKRNPFFALRGREKEADTLEKKEGEHL